MNKKEIFLGLDRQFSRGVFMGRSKKDKVRNMFTDCISDDLIYIRQFKEVGVDKKTKHLVEPLCMSSLCRLLIVSSVSGIDHYLNYSEDNFGETSEDYDNEILSLIKPPLEKQYMTVRGYLDLIEAKIFEFEKFVSKNHFKIQRCIIGDFVAIRMIRNAIVHSSWENSFIRDEKKRRVESIARRRFVIRAGFVTNLMKLDRSHWEKINCAEQDFLNFLYLNQILQRY